MVGARTASRRHESVVIFDSEGDVTVDEARDALAKLSNDGYGDLPVWVEGDETGAPAVAVILSGRIVGVCDAHVFIER